MHWWRRSTTPATTPATFRARSGSMCWRRCANARSVQFEALGAHESAEPRTLRHRILPGLVLRPAILGTLAEPVDVALVLVRLHRLATPVVGRDLFLEPILGIAIVVDRDVEAEPRAHDAAERRPASPQRRHRKDMLRQAEDVGDLLWMVADGADRAGPQPDPVGRRDEGREHDAGIDRGVEERVEIVVHERPTAPFEQQAM